MSTKAGVACATVFVLLFIAGFIANTRGSADAQVAVAFLSAPTSAFLFNALHAMAPGAIGGVYVGQESIAWCLLFMCGVLQYFVVGFVASLFITTGRDVDIANNGDSK